jgi:hypothetical protein
MRTPRRLVTIAVGLALAGVVSTTPALADGNSNTHDNYGIGNGNQFHFPINLNFVVCGNAIAILGVAGASC